MVTMWHQIEQAIIAKTGEPFKILEKQPLSAGLSHENLVDSNSKKLNLAFKISNGKQNYFVKLNSKEKLTHFISQINFCCTNWRTIIYNIPRL